MVSFIKSCTSRGLFWETVCYTERMAFGKLPVLTVISLFWRQTMENVTGDKHIQRGNPSACLVVESVTCFIRCSCALGSGALGTGATDCTRREPPGRNCMKLLPWLSWWLLCSRQMSQPDYARATEEERRTDSKRESFFILSSKWI